MIEIKSIIIKVPDETKHMHMFCHIGIEALDERELRVAYSWRSRQTDDDGQQVLDRIYLEINNEEKRKREFPSSILGRIFFF